MSKFFFGEEENCVQDSDIKPYEDGEKDVIRYFWK